MSKKKAGGKARQHKRPEGKRLGVKVSDGQAVSPGMILIRQRGSVFSKGKQVAMSRDFTIYAMSEGKVKFAKAKGKKVVSVID